MQPAPCTHTPMRSNPPSHDYGTCGRLPHYGRGRCVHAGAHEAPAPACTSLLPRRPVVREPTTPTSYLMERPRASISHPYTVMHVCTVSADPPWAVNGVPPGQAKASIRACGRIWVSAHRPRTSYSRDVGAPSTKRSSEPRPARGTRSVFVTRTQ